MGNKIRVTNPPEFYAHYLKVGEIHDITGHTEHGVEINHDYFLYNHEFEWAEESHESKLSCDEKEDSNYKVEDTIVASSNSLKKHGYMPIVNEVSYYEVSTFDASYILHEHLESIGYDIAGVWFDQESKTFRAIKKKV